MKNQRGYAAILIIVLVVIALAAAWTWLSLRWSYASGERVGVVQKLSKKGWICKTWEGELNMVVLPGAIPEKFDFTVRDDAVAEAINRMAGKRVSLQYEEHRFIPTTCFGDTSHFVTGVKALE
ncbi:MAG: hypothetical protein JNL68_17890 [Burkholderiales bacterium]|nr:hypothetical protein [Burkholderiales bacterium]